MSMLRVIQLLVKYVYLLSHNVAIESFKKNISRLFKQSNYLSYPPFTQTFINFRGTTEPIITPINLSSTIIRLNSKQWWASNSKVGVVVSLVYAWRIDEETVVVATIVEI